MAKSYEELTERKQNYIDAYLDTGDRVQSYLDAGYSPSPRSLRANANKLYRELADVIREEIDKRIGTGAVLALKIIRDLMTSAKSETVRLAAAKDYLQRAGYDTPVETRLVVDDLREVSKEDLRADIMSLLNKAKPVGDEKDGSEPTKH